MLLFFFQNDENYANVEKSFFLYKNSQGEIGRDEKKQRRNRERWKERKGFIDSSNIWKYEPHSFNCFIYLWLISFTALAGQNTCLNGLSNKNSSRVFFLFSAPGVTDFSSFQSKKKSWKKIESC